MIAPRLANCVNVDKVKVLHKLTEFENPIARRRTFSEYLYVCGSPGGDVGGTERRQCPF